MFNSVVQNNRDAEAYGAIRLSIQASAHHYSRPRENGLDLKDYEAVEIALIGERGLMRPESIGLPLDICELFEPGNSPVAGEVEWPVVERIRQCLRDRMK